MIRIASHRRAVRIIVFLEICIEGLFHLERWEHPDLLPLIRSNSIAILFPYLRTLVSMVTANANISPYVLPVMNIAAMFDHEIETDNKLQYAFWCCPPIYKFYMLL